MAYVADYATGGVREEQIVDEGEDEAADAKIDEVQTSARSVPRTKRGCGENLRKLLGLVEEVTRVRFSRGEVDNDGDKRTEDEVLQGNTGARGNRGEDGNALEGVLKPAGKREYPLDSH